MREGTVQIVNKLGIHARAATKLVSLTKTFPCTIQLGIERNALVNAKSMMSVGRIFLREATLAGFRLFIVDLLFFLSGMYFLAVFQDINRMPRHGGARVG